MLSGILELQRRKRAVEEEERQALYRGASSSAIEELQASRVGLRSADYSFFAMLSGCRCPYKIIPRFESAICTGLDRCVALLLDFQKLDSK